MNSSQENNNEKFHNLWTKAVHQEGYVKKEWQEFQSILEYHRVIPNINADRRTRVEDRRAK